MRSIEATVALAESAAFNKSTVQEVDEFLTALSLFPIRTASIATLIDKLLEYRCVRVLDEAMEG